MMLVRRCSKKWFISSLVAWRHREIPRCRRGEDQIVAGGVLATVSLVALTEYLIRSNETGSDPGHVCNNLPSRLAELGFFFTSSRNRSPERDFSHTNSWLCTTTRCDDGLLYAEKDFPDGYSEAERFFEVLAYHRSLLPDYVHRWSKRSSRTYHARWPRNVPSTEEISSLELDLRFCSRSPNYRDATSACQDLQFRIASYYLSRDDSEDKKKGFQMIRDLAEHGHPDGMCFYGILLNQGIIEGVEADPKQAVVWWRRCVDYHGHIWAAFEMGVALYTGEGVAENAVLASKVFRQAAHLGHAGAAYMLGDLLLNGVGVDRDRASALEWLVTAAELGHPLAREKVMVIIRQDYESLERGDTGSKGHTETLKWVSNPDNKQSGKGFLTERRFTIGGGSRNPEVLKRRTTIVKESRQEKENDD